MDLKDSIKEAMYDLPDTEKLIVLSVMIDTLMDSMEDMKKEIRFIRSIPVSKIDMFPDHPFYLDDDEDMKDLVLSIKNYGILTPGAVRIKGDGRYELLSGHRRLRACQLAGLDSMSCEVLTLTDEEAAMFMIESNRQRPKLCPTEKGLVYKYRDEASGIPQDRKHTGPDPYARPV